MTTVASPPRDREAEILDAALVVLAKDGIGGVSMRAVARTAGVSLGLASYYYSDKDSLIAAALTRIGERDLDIVRVDDGTPAERLRTALRRVAEPEYLDRAYLSLRLQLWALANVNPTFARINRTAQQRYRRHLAALIAAAVPSLAQDDAAARANEILVVQNGIWLTTAIIADETALARSVERCEQIAFAPPPSRRTTR